MHRTQQAWVLAAAVALGVTSLAPGASAYSERVRNACTSDYLNLCSQYDPDSRQTTSCMQRNESRLSAGCLRALKSEGYRSGGGRR